MDDNKAIEGLKRLGLTTYEARVFLALQKLGHGTASEISEVEDVPRSQVYGAAEQLEDRGLVETQQSTPTVYRPISLEQARTLLLDQLAQTGSETFNYLEQIQETQDQQEQSESLWLINSKDAIVSRTVSIIEQTESHLLYGVDEPALIEETILDALESAANDDVAVLVASANETVLERFAGGSYETFRVPEQRNLDVSTGRLLVADSHTILLSTLSASGTETENGEVAFWTSDNPFASVLAELVEAWFQNPFQSAPSD